MATPQQAFNLGGAPRGKTAGVHPREAGKPALPPPSFGKVLQLMLFKNLTINRRRKVEQLLMLFQIFIWFGWGALRFVTSGQMQWLPAVVPQRGEAHIPFFKQPDFPPNHPIAVSCVHHPEFHAKESYHQNPEAMFEGHPTVDSAVMTRVLEYFTSYWQRTMGNQPFMFYSHNGTLGEGVRLDERPIFGIVFESLDATAREATISLAFFDDEVPIPLTFHGHREACREIEMRFDAQKKTKLTPMAHRSCEAGKYLASPFVLAQTVLESSVIAAFREKLPDVEENPLHKKSTSLRTPLSNRMELPGVTVVAEDFPLHRGLHTAYPDLATGTPIFILFAFSRFTISAVHGIVAEKETK